MSPFMGRNVPVYGMKNSNVPVYGIFSSFSTQIRNKFQNNSLLINSLLFHFFQTVPRVTLRMPALAGGDFRGRNRPDQSGERQQMSPFMG